MSSLLSKRQNGKESSVNPWTKDFFNVENMFNRDLWNQVGQYMPAVNVSENDKSFFVDVMAPGFKKEDFKVNVENNVLTISAESKSESNTENKQYSRREYNYSSFTRSFRLPENAKDDTITATYKDGVLKLIVAKTKRETKSGRDIKIS